VTVSVFVPLSVKVVVTVGPGAVRIVTLVTVVVSVVGDVTIEV